jgi:hypothetical protein
MLPDALILEIRRLLDEGQLTHRLIAAKVGVSRGLVTNISRGRRNLRMNGEGKFSIPARCRHCGGMVYKPCVLCRTRAYQLRHEVLRLTGRESSDDRNPRRVA